MPCSNLFDTQVSQFTAPIPFLYWIESSTPLPQSSPGYFCSKVCKVVRGSAFICSLWTVSAKADTGNGLGASANRVGVDYRILFELFGGFAHCPYGIVAKFGLRLNFWIGHRMVPILEFI